MATHVQPLASMEGGLVTLSCTYDDASAPANLVTTLTLVNDSAVGTMTATLFDRTTGAVVVGPISRGFGTGTFNVNVSGRNEHMLAETDKGGHPILVFPFAYSVNWTPA